MLACLWLATSPEYFRLATRYIWSDLPYFALAALTLLLADHLRQGSGRWRVAIAAGLAVAMAAAVIMRSAGIGLIAAFGAPSRTPGARWTGGREPACCRR
jgi:hypothetical protein